MKQKEEQQQLNKLWKKMRLHFKSFTHTQDAEALHQFRVQVKKIRSFLTLLEVGTEHGRLQKTFIPVKKIFKSAGVVRDAYLHQEQARNHGLLQNEFYDQQEAIQKREAAKLIRKSDKHLGKMKAVKKELYKHLRPLTDNDIKTFYLNSLVEAKRIFMQHHFDEQLHDGRKILKHLMYNQQAIGNDLRKDLGINFTYIDDLQQLLGQWHDTALALLFFEENLDAKELQSMEAKKAQLQTQITRQSKNFDKKVLGSEG